MHVDLQNNETTPNNMGKGSRQRPPSITLDQFSSNWDTIFKKDTSMQVKVTENKDEIGKCGCGRSPTGKCIGWHGLTEDAFQAKLASYNSEKTANS